LKRPARNLPGQRLYFFGSKPEVPGSHRDKTILGYKPAY
jgi:hypothetical protein